MMTGNTRTPFLNKDMLEALNATYILELGVHRLYYTYAVFVICEQNGNRPMMTPLHE